MAKGVWFRPWQGTKPFEVKIPDSRYFSTKAEAVAAREAYRAGRLRAKAAVRAALAEKRARDVARNGQSMARERGVSLALVLQWKYVTGLPAKVLNDGTKADVLLGQEGGGWLRVQVKTTGGAAKRNQNRSWKFSGVTGYSGMPVVCWRCDKRDAWVFDGGALDERGTKLKDGSGLGVTPGFTNCKLALARGLNLVELVKWLRFNDDTWPLVTEELARHEFESESHAKEMRGIDMYKARFPGEHYAWPDEQGTHVDLLKGATRLQFKTACAAPDGTSGFKCHLYTYAGTDEKGTQLHDPYPAGAFDELVVVVWLGNTARFWQIPEAKLVEHGYLRSGSQPGKKSLKLHATTIGVQPSPHACKPADTWTDEYFFLG